MASKSIGSVYAELSVKDKTKAGLNRAQKSLEAFGSKLASIGTGFAVAIPAAAFAGLAASMKSAIDAGGKLSDMMARTGADGEQLFVLQRAFENAGVAGDKVPAVLNKMQKALAGVNEEGERVQTRVFKDLGFDIAALQAKDPADAFRALSESISKIPDPAKRAAVAMEIFGRSGAELLVVMNDGKAFENAATQVGGLGKTLSDNAARLDNVSDAMGLLGVKAQQIGAEIAVELLPVLEEFANFINEMDLGGATKEFIEYAKAIGSAADKAAELIAHAPGMKQLGLIGRGAEAVISGIASFNPEKGEALAPQYGGGDSFQSHPLSNYNEGIMLPPSVEKAMQDIPDLLKRRPELVGGMRLEDAGIPGLAGMMDAIAESIIPREQNRETELADFEATSFGVNEMQARGLGMGGMGVVNEAQKQVDLLVQIRDVLKKASSNKQLTWD